MSDTFCYVKKAVKLAVSKQNVPKITIGTRNAMQVLVFKNT